MKLCLWLTVLALTLGAGAQGQWSTKWLQEEAYWGDGKAEFNVYEAREVRYGQPRGSNVIHIYEREAFDPAELVQANDPKQPGTHPVIKLNQVLYIPTGIYSQQQMHSSYWKPDTGQLLKATLSSSDSIGNTYKELRALTGWRSWLRGGWSFHWHTYLQGQSEGNETIHADKDATFYDELPMRVRTIDFSAGAGTFAIPLAPSILGAKAEKITFTPATIEWRRRSSTYAQPSGVTGHGAITVTVKLRGSLTEDVFILDAKPPYHLREWRKSDGGTLRLQRSFKIDYKAMNKLGDQARLLQMAEEAHAKEHQAPSPEGAPAATPQERGEE